MAPSNSNVMALIGTEGRQRLVDLLLQDMPEVSSTAAEMVMGWATSKRTGELVGDLVDIKIKAALHPSVSVRGENSEQVQAHALSLVIGYLVGLA